MQRQPEADPHGRRSDPVVVFIAGSGRSGSTLVERMLGGIPGTVNVGELLDLPRRVAPRDERCGCGERFSDCPFWTAVGQRVPGGWSAEELSSLHRLQTQVARQRHLPRLLVGSQQGRFGRDVGAYAERVGAIYAAAADVASADYVVDASKWPSLALALHRGGVDIRVLHLVRDVRGVANSLAHGSVVRPHGGPDEDRMYQNRPSSAAGRWLATQAEVDLMAVRGLPVSRVRYDDLVAAPGPVLREALAELGIAVPPGGLSHVDGRTVTLPPSHGLSGNPSRFSSGETELRPDLRWREGMSSGERLLVQSIGLPWLLRYRRLARSAASDRATATPSRAGSFAAMPGTAGSTETWPLVSAVVATHGRPELVREAVESAVRQDYPGDLEIVVVHDQEPVDESLRELAVPGRMVTLAENTHSPGLAGSRNTGVDLAKGDFVATLDDDDVWRPEKIRRQVQRLQSDPEPLMVGTGLRLLLPEGRTADWRGRSPRIPYETLLRNRVKELHSSTLMMRRDAFAKAGRYDEQLPHGYAEDYDWVLRVGRVGPIGMVIEPLADIRKNNVSYYRGRAARTAPALLHFLDKHPEIAADRRGHARILGQVAFALSSNGERAEAARYAARSWARWPLSPHAYVALAAVASGADSARFAALARRFGRGMA